MSFLARGPAAPTTPQAPSSPPTARRHWRRWALAAVALGAVVVLLPAIAAHTPLLPWVVGIAAGDLKGSFKIESASLGWFSPITARGVELRDEKDRPLLVAPTLTGTRSLLAIALHPTTLGEFQLDQPELNLLLRSDGSNVEDVLAKYLTSEEPSEGVDVALKVTGGNVLLTDESTGRSWKIKNLELSLSTTAGPDGPLRLETSATIADPQQPATISVKANLGQPAAGKPAAGKPAANSTTTYAGEAQVDAQAVPLAILEPLLNRVTAQSRLAGRLSSRIHAQWGGSDPAAATVVEADLTGADLSMAAAALGSDVVQLRRLEGNCRIAGQGDRLEIKQLSADCDVGNVSLIGSLDLSGRQTASTLDLALKQTYEIKGRLDLALLARMLPKTLSLRPGMEITTGQVQLALSSRASAPGANSPGAGAAQTTWQGRIEADRLTAFHNGRQLAWQRPLLATLDALYGAQGLVVNSLRCESDFFKLDMAGTSDQLAADAEFKLQQLAVQLGQFVDLGGLGLSGDGWAHFGWQRVGPQQFKTAAELQLRGFQLAMSDQRHWSEDELRLFFTADATSTPADATGKPAGGVQLQIASNTPANATANATGKSTGGIQVQNATLQILAGADQLDARLTQPVANPGSDSVLPVEVTVKGQLQPWLARVRPWLAENPAALPANSPLAASPLAVSPSAGWNLAGSYELTAQLTGSLEQLNVSRARLFVEQLVLQSPPQVQKNAILPAADVAGMAGVMGASAATLPPWLNVVEPSAELVLAGSWDRKQRRVNLDPATLNSGGLSIEANQVVLAMPAEGPWKTTGELKYRGNIETLSRWFAEPNKPPAWNVSGQLAGTAQLTQADGVTGGQLAADVGNLLIKTSAGESFSEPTVRLTARGQYAHQAGVLQLEQMQLTSNMLTADAAGKTGPSGQQTGLEMQGHVKYDLAKLAGVLRPYLGQEIQVTGVGNSPVSYQGLLASPTAGTAAASVGWQQADLYGFVIGPGELKLKLAGGMLVAEPMDLAASGGRLRLAPQLRLSPGPMELILPAGPLVQKAQISPQMCASRLKYIAPVLADVTAAQGDFSIELDGCRLPLDDMTKAEVAGRFTIHSVQIGPGPLVQELAVLLGRASPASLRRESVIPFRMVGGRMYHEGMELVFPDLTIRTRGSVGLDQSLQILAEMPIPPKWLVNQVLDSALRDQVIRLPIGGTLSKPQIDRRELERLSSQFVRTAAQNLLQGEVSRQLDRLLGPPR